MRPIFEEASSTIGWLGEASGAKLAIRLLNKVDSWTSLPDTSLPLPHDEAVEWAELRKMLSNPWFGRMWIVQEIAVTPQPWLRYGDEEISWETFARTMTILSRSGLRDIYLLPESSLGQFWDSHGLENTLIIETVLQELRLLITERYFEVMLKVRGYPPH